jgi:hypothetical protein
VADRTELLSRLAALPLACVTREFPYKVDHVVEDRDTRLHRELHPAFYGCFDWHSAVHGHWMLVRLWKQAARDDIRAVLDANLTPEHLAIEAAYFTPTRASFERPYGWAWALALATETLGTPWGAALEPLAAVIVERYLAFLPKQTYPVRTGVHANTAFGLAFALDHARAVQHAALERLIVERALAYYGSDVDYPAAWEPSGEDFFSPALVEADLMRRVVPDFAAWLRAFLPAGLPAALANPAVVSDRNDPKLAHLDGLNLSRAWCLQAIAAALPANEREPYAVAAALHARAGLANVTTGDYAGEHWLATFATYLLTTS